MGSETIGETLPEDAGNEGRKRWSAPVIEDADISAITHGSGTSGFEGNADLKAGS